MQMIQHYFTTALRLLYRDKIYSVITVLSFSLGLAAAIAIMLWVHHEWSFNRFHSKLDRIHCVQRVHQSAKERVVTSAITGAFAQAAVSTIPEIEQVVQITLDRSVFAVGKNIFREEGLLVSPVFLTTFDVPLVAGTPELALGNLNSVVLTESFARKLFGKNDISSMIGKVVRLDGVNDGTMDFTVTAICRDMPRNSSIRFEYLLSVERVYRLNPQELRWDNSSFRTYLLLRENASIARVNAQLKDFLSQKGGINDGQTLFTQPLAETHLYGRFVDGVQSGGRIDTVRMFVWIAVLLLVLSCVNFTNLSTARSLRRAKEIGVRKSIGASRSQLLRQMLGESLFMALLAIPIALFSVELALPLLNEMIGATLKLPLTEAWFIGLLGGMSLFIGLLGGIYPAMMSSSFSTINILKNTLKTGVTGASVRRILVVVQFAVATAFIAGTIIIYRQIIFIQTKDLGLNRENLVAVPVSLSAERFAAWKQELQNERAILSVAASDAPSPIQLRSNTSAMNWRGKKPDERMNVFHLHGDEDFIKTLGIEMQDGRAFSSRFPADTANYIINETCARQMHLANPVGETLRWGSGKYAQIGTIVGVVKDFHFKSLREEIEPMMFTFGTAPAQVFVRFASGRTEEGMNIVRRGFEKYQPDLPFTYTFLDDEFDAMYRSERVVGQLAFAFSSIAVLMCCLGLLGLVVFMAETRTKEIGIRKVLGASVASIIGLLSKDFLKLVGISIVIATPLAYWVAQKWLQDFAYKTELSWWIFAVAGVSAVGIAFMTVAGQAWRAALANPVQSLKSE